MGTAFKASLILIIEHLKQTSSGIYKIQSLPVVLSELKASYFLAKPCLKIKRRWSGLGQKFSGTLPPELNPQLDNRREAKTLPLGKLSVSTVPVFALRMVVLIFSAVCN